MKRRRVELVLAGVLVAAVVAVVVWPGEKELEPEYQGKKLSEWLVIYVYGNNPVNKALAVEAVRHIDTNALPWLLNWLCYERGPWRDKLDQAVQNLPEPLRADEVSTSAEARTEGSLHGFEILGRRASPAVPELKRLLSGPGRQTPLNAIRALAYIGRDGLPALLAVLGNTQPRHRQDAASVIGSMRFEGTNVSTAVPVLVQCLTDKDSLVAQTAAKTLGLLALEPGFAVPALTNSLHSTDGRLRICAVRAIGNFGNAARLAVPAMLDALNEPEPIVRDAAKNALMKIAPECMPEKDRRK